MATCLSANLHNTGSPASAPRCWPTRANKKPPCETGQLGIGSCPSKNVPKCGGREYTLAHVVRPVSQVIAPSKMFAAIPSPLSTGPMWILVKAQWEGGGGLKSFTMYRSMMSRLFPLGPPKPVITCITARVYVSNRLRMCGAYVHNSLMSCYGTQCRTTCCTVRADITTYKLITQTQGEPTPCKYTNLKVDAHKKQHQTHTYTLFTYH
jgi:hypothetical protein